jgi:antitoxin FitA
MPMGAIQIKNVPRGLHEQLRRRARTEGRTLSEWALQALERELSLPSTKEWLERLQTDPSTDISSVEISRLIERGRGERDEQILSALADRH